MQEESINFNLPTKTEIQKNATNREAIVSQRKDDVMLRNRFTYPIPKYSPTKYIRNLKGKITIKNFVLIYFKFVEQ